ncbi:hypothetical protein JCM3770_004160 [Rhodotorula araucariae]
MLGYVARMLMSFAKSMSNANGAAMRFPDLLRIDEPIYGINKKGQIEQLKVRGTKYGRPLVEDVDEYVPRRRTHKTKDLMAVTFTPTVSGNPGCANVGCKNTWTVACFKLCDDCNDTRVALAGPLIDLTTKKKVPHPLRHKDSLDAHAEKHEDGETFSCLDPDCEATYASLEARRRHIKVKHPKLWADIHTCECGMQYRTIYELSAHRKWHDHPNPAPSRTCDDCEMFFSTDQARSNHRCDKHPRHGTVGQENDKEAGQSRPNKRQRVDPASFSSQPPTSAASISSPRAPQPLPRKKSLVAALAAPPPYKTLSAPAEPRSASSDSPVHDTSTSHGSRSPPPLYSSRVGNGWRILDHQLVHARCVCHTREKEISAAAEAPASATYLRLGG